MQWAFYFDQTRCIGCYTCCVACKDWHDIPAGPIHWRRVTTMESGKYPDVKVAFLSLSCVHCAKPACVAACPAAAISKRRADGVVVVDAKKCLGKETCGGLCVDACPYGAPQFGSEFNAKMSMCNLCIDRLGEGKSPICVAACPVYALDAGPIEGLVAKYGKPGDAEGFTYSASAKLKPSVIFKPKSSSPDQARRKK